MPARAQAKCRFRLGQLSKCGARGRQDLCDSHGISHTRSERTIEQSEEGCCPFEYCKNPRNAQHLCRFTRFFVNDCRCLRELNACTLYPLIRTAFASRIVCTRHGPDGIKVSSMKRSVHSSGMVLLRPSHDLSGRSLSSFLTCSWFLDLRLCQLREEELITCLHLELCTLQMKAKALVLKCSWLSFPK